MEQLATNRFIEGLRRAVQKHIANQAESPPSPLPHYAYNNTTKELARLHGYPHYHQSYPNSQLDSSTTHLGDNLEHHVCLFEHKCISEARQGLLSQAPKQERSKSSGFDQDDHPVRFKSSARYNGNMEDVILFCDHAIPRNCVLPWFTPWCSLAFFPGGRCPRPSSQPIT